MSKKPTKPSEEKATGNVAKYARAFHDALESFKHGFSDDDAEKLRVATKNLIGK